VSSIGQDEHETLETLFQNVDLSLAEEIPGRRGPRKRELALFTYIGEIISHKGQIAAIRGNIKRLREKDPKFLT